LFLGQAACLLLSPGPSGPQSDYTEKTAPQRSKTPPRRRGKVE
jgi:hypothetical protein